MQTRSLKDCTKHAAFDHVERYTDDMLSNLCSALQSRCIPNTMADMLDAVRAYFEGSIVSFCSCINARRSLN